jgi:hypothetical protein
MLLWCRLVPLVCTALAGEAIAARCASSPPKRRCSFLAPRSSRPLLPFVLSAAQLPFGESYKYIGVIFTTAPAGAAQQRFGDHIRRVASKAAPQRAALGVLAHQVGRLPRSLTRSYLCFGAPVLVAAALGQKSLARALERAQLAALGQLCRQ